MDHLGNCVKLVAAGGQDLPHETWSYAELVDDESIIALPHMPTDTEPSPWHPITNMLQGDIKNFTTIINPTGSSYVIPDVSGVYRVHIDLRVVNALGGAQRQMQLGSFINDILVGRILDFDLYSNDIGSISWNGLGNGEAGDRFDFRIRKFAGPSLDLTLHRVNFGACGSVTIP